MSEPSISSRRYRNGRQKQARIQMIEAAASQLASFPSSRGQSSLVATTKTNTSTYDHNNTGTLMEDPMEDPPVDAPPTEVDITNDSSSILSSDEEPDLMGLANIDDEFMFGQQEVVYPNSDNATPSKQSKLVENTEVAALELLALCQEVNSPLYMYDQLLAILKRHHKSGVLDVKKMPSRETLMFKLRERLHPPVPFPHLVQTAGGTDVEVTKFYFLDQLQDLLRMSYFDDIHNLCANTEETQRFNRYKATPQDELLEVCACGWYNQTFDMLGVSQKRKGEGSDETDQFLMPLIFYVDKTGTDVSQRYPLEPLMFTTAILRRDIRRKSDSWRHLGFIPPDSVKAQGSSTPLGNVQSYHDCLSALLDDLIQLQQHPPKLEVNLGGMKKAVTVRLPVAFVIGDQVSQDVLCGKRPSSTSGSPRIHRSCMCSQLHCSINGRTTHSKHVGCTPVPLKAIRQLTLAVTSLPDLLEDAKHGLDTNEATRGNVREIASHKTLMRRRADLATRILTNTLGLYPIKNAFDKVCFGSNDNGIHTATMNDIMHFNEGGLILNIAQVAYGIIPPKRREDILEKGISGIFSSSKSSVRCDYPRGFFKTGFSDLTLLTSGEKVGVIFALLVALRLDENIRSTLYEKGVVESQEKYMSFPMDSSPDGDVKLDPDSIHEDKAVASTPKSKKRKKECMDRKKMVKPEESTSHPLELFPLASVTPFLRNKGKNKNKKNQYSLSADGISSVARHLKLHDLREILDADLDALQMHYLMRDVWEVVNPLSDANYPTTPHEIISLSESDEGGPDLDDTTVAVYSYIPPNDNGGLAGCDERESHFRRSFLEEFGLEILKEQICAFHENMEDDLLSMYELPESPRDKRVKLSKGASGPTNAGEIRSKPNGDKYLFAGNLKTIQKKTKKILRKEQSYFITKHGRDKNVKTPSSAAVLSDVDTFCEMLEVTLLHHAFLHYAETLSVEQRRDLSTFQNGIVHYMNLVDKCVYRGDNTLDTGTAKFHCHYQTCHVVPVYGDPSQYEAGSCERGLKTWAKKASHTAQKNKNVEVFSFQTAWRVSDSQLLAKAQDMASTTLAEMAGAKNTWVNPWQKKLSEKRSQATAQMEGNYFFARIHPNYRLDVRSKRVSKLDRKGNEVEGSATRLQDAKIHKQILYAVMNAENVDEEDGVENGAPLEYIDIWGELQDGFGNWLRATPLYPLVGPWYDWVLVHFEKDDGQEAFLPAKCLLFYMGRDGEPCAIVHSVCWKPIRDKNKSFIFSEWQKEYKDGVASLHRVPISAIQRGVYAFEKTSEVDQPVNSKKLCRAEEIREKVVILSPRTTWASKFHEWCRAV